MPVEVLSGDPFDSDGAAVVVPFAADGRLGAEARERLPGLVLPRQREPFVPGQIVPRQDEGGRTVLFAMVDGISDLGEQEGAIVRAGVNIGALTQHSTDVVATPVLADEAVSPERFRALFVSGFNTAAHAEAVLRIYTKAPPKNSRTVEDLRARHAGSGAIAAGVVVADLLPGLDEKLAGPVRGIDEHLAVVRSRWSTRRVPTLHADHVVLGLGLDDGVVLPLLLKPGLLDGWRFDGLPWDQLTDGGRRLAEDQPLLATALGAPAEWTVEFPEPVTAVAFTPGGDRIAVLAGNAVYVAGSDGTIGRAGPVTGRVVSLGWSRDDLLALRVDDGGATLIRAESGTVVGTFPGATGGRIGDGPVAWLTTEDGVVRWRAGDDHPNMATPGDVVFAMNGNGSRALVGSGSEALVVSTLLEDRPPGSTENPPIIGRSGRGADAYALLSLGGAAIASAQDGRLTIVGAGGPPLALVRTEGEPIDVLAANGAGQFLAVGSGKRVSVWPCAPTRPVARSVAGYASDRDAAGADLLDADRDAESLAALIASAELRPPLAIGLFGEWGSGKTFVLERIGQSIDRLGAAEDGGYLRDIRVVRFNAWHYAETNLWASLVDHVLRTITSGRPEVVDAQPEVEQADREVTEAEQAERARAEELAAARDAEKAVKRKRLRFWLVVGCTVAAVAGGVIATLLGVAVWAALVVVGGWLAAAAGVLGTVQQKATEATTAGREAKKLLPNATTAREAQARRVAAEKEADEAKAETERRRVERDNVRRQAETDPLAVVLRQLSSVTEFREQLSLVTRTRDWFERVDHEFVRQGGRVVVTIDDLDRCPAEKVVQVLEAVHLLFDFEMFVVVLAVDTRWLEQSLRIRYHQLLGDAGSATPTDYLEKIIQLPVRLTSLDESLVRRMITGLIGPAATPVVTPGAPPTTPERPEPAAPIEKGTAATAAPRTRRKRLPAKVLSITAAEAAAMSAAAPLVGTTPRTVKRFVNTYRLIKARAEEPAEFDRPRYGVGDHEVVAFLLAAITGRHGAPALLAALADPTPGGTLNARLGKEDPDLDPIRTWLAANPRIGEAPVHRFTEWAPEVSRFSF